MTDVPASRTPDGAQAAADTMTDFPVSGLYSAASILRGRDRVLRDPTLLEGFRYWVRESGSRAAVVDGGIVRSYAELNRRSNQLAGLLQKQGARPGVLVGVALPRSVGLVETLLAVVKTGAAYAPLDPDYPAVRLSSMLEQARPRVVVTLESLVPRLPVNVEETRADAPSVLCLDRAGALLERESPDDFPTSATPDDPLYVIFTSGSTGRPKGALVHRRGFANLVEWFCEEFALTHQDRTLLLTSPSFDLTQKNFFGPLLTGGTLVCYPPGPFDLVALTQVIEREGITILNCTPSAFYPLTDALSHDVLRLVVLGGEPIALPRIRPWLERPGQREIANTYGPTECADICAFYRLRRGNVGDLSLPFVPLGEAVPNVQLAVTDEYLHPVPRGEAGELMIGGMGVGLGYLGGSAGDSSGFQPNPLPGVLEGATAYRTGDRVRFSGEGLIEFLGRMDHQVKLRGYRIELPEIEAVLAAHPAVREAAVVLVPSPADPLLTAFYIPQESGRGIPASELREFLASRLAAYMIPAKFCVLEKFPLTPNGKVDRLRLAASPGTDGQPAPSPAPTTTGLEAVIQELWNEALSQNHCGLDDNFFDLGGNSILLAVIHTRLIRRLSRPIPITDLFAHPTIRSLAAHLDGGKAGASIHAIRTRAQKQRAALGAQRAIKK